MRRMLLWALLLPVLLLAGCTVSESAVPEQGQPGCGSSATALFTDGSRVFLLRRGKTLPEWASTFAVYEVTGGGMRRIVSGRNADDAAMAGGMLCIASHTEDWLKPMAVSAELDAYAAADGRRLLQAGAWDESRINPDRFAFHVAGERLIRQRTYVVRDGGRQHEFAFVDPQGNVGEPFFLLPFAGVKVTDSFIAGAAWDGDEVRIFDLEAMEEYCLPALWGRDEWGSPVLPEGVLLAGVLYYPAADGIRATGLATGADWLFAAVDAPEYFYVMAGWLYTVADDGLLTAYDLSTGTAETTGIMLTKADRYVVAGRNAYILQTPELHGVRTVGCRLEHLTE